MSLSLKHPAFLGEFNKTVLPELEALKIITCSFDTSDADIETFASYGLAIPQGLSRAVLSRKIEFLTGRYLAKILLEESNSESSYVGRGDHSQPIWPSGYIGSISHSGAMAACVLASTGDVHRIGIDIERYFTREQISEIGSRISCASEVDIGRNSSLSDEQIYALIFSAKESVFKAIFPAVNRYFEFSDVMLTHIDEATGKFEVEVVGDLAPKIQPGHQLKGRFLLEKETVMTLIT